MDESAADRDLLLGLLALRRGVGPDALGGAIEAWATDGRVPLGRVLLARGAIDGAALRSLEGDLAAMLRSHGGDAQAGLSAVVGAGLPGIDLRRLTLPDLKEALSRISSDATLGATMGTAVEATIGATLGPVAPVESEATLAGEPTAPPRPGPRPSVEDEPEATVAGTLGPDATAEVPGAVDLGATIAGVEATEAATAAGPGAPEAGAGAVTRAIARLRYRIVREHAKGGLGEVFLAFDEELNREVALKEIQGRHADDAESRSRFLIEAEVTGRLEHPGIIPVYGLGQYPDGRPYYAMRFVRGDSLKEAIDRFHQAEGPGRDQGRRELELRQLLGHFVDVCQAISYAHARGIIHRDLKPANVMLGAFGETLVVDWGLAKPIGEPTGGAPSGLAPLVPVSGGSGGGTLHGSVVGTPQYASPEQAGGQIDAMGPPSDIYSLGATLYYLLAGVVPVQERGVLALLEKVRRGEFPPPRQANPRVPRALEAICLKAMALEPSARYDSARALAEDVERWMGDEPVSAYREPWADRAARWVKRHKLPVAVAGAILLVSSAGLTIGALLLERERARTEANFRLATDAVDELLSEVGQVELADVPQMEPVRRRLLEKALSFYYNKFLDARRDDPATRLETVRASVRLANIDELLGDYPSAEARYRRAVEVLGPLSGRRPGGHDYRRDLARARHGLGILLRKSGRFAESEASLREALALRKALAGADPTVKADYADTLYHLAALLAKLASREPEVEEAYAAAEAELKALPADDTSVARRRARLLNNLGIFRRATVPAEARDEFRGAVAIQRSLSAGAPGVAGLRWELARTLNNLGGVNQELEPDDPGVPLGLFEEARDQFKRLADDFPSIPDYRLELSEVLLNLANLRVPPPDPARRVKVSRKDYDRAVAEAADAATLLKGLAARNPLRPDYRHKLALAGRTRGRLSEAGGKAEESRAESAASVELLRRLVDDHRDVPEYESDLALALRGVVNLLVNQGKIDEARARLEEAIRHQRAAVDATARNGDSKKYLAADLILLAAIDLKGRRDPEGVAKLVEESLGLAPPDEGRMLLAAGLLSGCAGLAAESASLAPTGAAPAPGSFQDRALDLLDELARRRYLIQGRLDNKDFDPLRDLPRFKAIRDRLPTLRPAPVG